jgi:hypothetical protein
LDTFMVSSPFSFVRTSVLLRLDVINTFSSGPFVCPKAVKDTEGIKKKNKNRDFIDKFFYISTGNVSGLKLRTFTIV